jgi:hypothetical protein
MAALFAASAILFFVASEIGLLVARRTRENESGGDAGTLAGASLGLLALLIGFTFSISLSRYDARREAVLQEANAIGSTANFALMLPERQRRPILDLLRQYAQTRTGLGVPYDPIKFQRDVARSIDLQNRLWQQATIVAKAAPQSLPTYEFVSSLNDVNNAHERRLTTLRVRLPVEVFLVLEMTTIVAMGFVGFQIGAGTKRRIFARAAICILVAALIAIVVDLDRPSRGLIFVSVQPLVDATQGIPAK